MKLDDWTPADVAMTIFITLLGVGMLMLIAGSCHAAPPVAGHIDIDDTELEWPDPGSGPGIWLPKETGAEGIDAQPGGPRSGSRAERSHGLPSGADPGSTPGRPPSVWAKLMRIFR